MANYIKIPLAINPPRKFKTQALAGTATWASATGTLVAGTAVTGQAVVNGSGSGAIATIQVSGGTALSNVTATITTAGEGYKVGDIITFAAETTGAGASTWSEPLAFTVVAADLIAVDGNETNEYYLFDVDQLISVDYQFGATPDMKLWTNATALSTGTTYVPTKVELTFDTDPALDDGIAGEDLSKAIFKAIENPNSLPTVEFTNGIELIEVTLN